MTDLESGATAPAVVDTPVAAPEATDAPDPTAGQESEATPEAKQEERLFKQSELDKIVQKEKAQAYRKAEREAQAREDRIRQEVEQRIAKARPQPAPSGEPKLEQFSSYEEYIKAGIRYEAKQLREQEREQDRQAYQQTNRQRYEQERVAAIQPKVDKAAEKYEDFHEVAHSFDAPEAMQEAMLDSDITGELYYYLGSNPAERVRISNLSPIRQVAAILKLEEKLSAPPSTTKTPAPITPSSPAGASTKSTSEMSDAEWIKWRESDIKQKRAR